MGVPKQKWTSEEEAALKAGVAKYGAGKWSTILKDSEFTPVLHLRSNVDLKDKWRNLNMMASGYGNRHRATPAKLKVQPVCMPQNIFPARNEEHNVKSGMPDSPTILTGSFQKDSSKMPIPRLDDLILEIITNLKEPHGSSRAAITEYIEEKHSVPPNLGKLLRAELKALIDSGKLIKVRHRYRVRRSPSLLDSKKKLLRAKHEDSPMAETSTIKILTKAEIDAELEKMRSMTPQEAAAVAVKAVAEAEAAISEAEKAAREAESAEADAELAQVFAAAAMQALKRTVLCT